MTEQARDTEALIRDQIAKHAVLLYMKGTPQFPQCGFSARAVEALSQIGRPFAYVNILENPDIRALLPQIANWPTFPQLWINGELIGGSDIILDMFQKGELQPLVEQHSPAPSLDSAPLFEKNTSSMPATSASFCAAAVCQGTSNKLLV
jgi:monothiol glutaredoxin